MTALLFHQIVAKLPTEHTKKALKRRSDATKDMIEVSLDYTQKLESFDDNFHLDKLAKHLEAYKMSRNKKNTPPRQQAGGALKYYYDIEKDEDRDNDSYVEQSFYNKDALSPPRATWASRQTAGVVGFPALFAQHSQVKSFQLVQSADANANDSGLLVMIGNSNLMTYNKRGFLNQDRITKQLPSPADYEKAEFTLVPGYPSLLQIRTYN